MVHHHTKNVQDKYLIIIYPLAIDSLHDRGHDHSDGMQRGVPRDIAHAVGHFECTVE
jgi:hypothetical protein